MIKSRVTENIHPYREFADAIIIQACDDYRDGYRSISLDRDGTGTEYRINDAVSFFHSDWYKFLTGIDADYLIKKLNRDIVDKLKEDCIKAWEDIRISEDRAIAIRKMRHLTRFVRSSKFSEVSDESPREIIAEVNEEALKKLLADYEKALKQVDRGKDVENAMDDIKAIKKFMRSDIFSEMTSLDPEKLIARMERS